MPGCDTEMRYFQWLLRHYQGLTMDTIRCQFVVYPILHSMSSIPTGAFLNHKPLQLVMSFKGTGFIPSLPIPPRESLSQSGMLLLEGGVGQHEVMVQDLHLGLAVQ